MPTKSPHIFPIDTAHPDRRAIKVSAEVIGHGGLVIFPTNTFYGLGARAFDEKAVEKVYAVKKRDPHKPLLVLIASEEELFSLVRDIPPTAVALMKALWPGNITLVFEALPVLPHNLTGGTERIGVRLAGHPVAVALLKACGYPITATSANLTGKGGCATIEQLEEEMLASVNVVLDAGPLPGIVASTVVDVTVFPPAILREGMVTAKEVAKVLKGW